MSTYTAALWYGRGRVAAMNGLGTRNDRDAELFAAQVLHDFGVRTPTVNEMDRSWDKYEVNNEVEGAVHGE